jgi:polyisoprenoid-binding protein YceI
MSTTTEKTTRTFKVDKNHSEAYFQVRHLITKVRGHFADFEGTIEFDAAQPVRSHVEFVIQTASIDTNQADRDAHLRNDDFFAVDKFPTLTFKSTGITPKGGDDYLVAGDLTIKDVTKRITVPVTHLGMAKDPWGNEKLAFEAEFVINRKDFGLVYNAVLETGGFVVGDDVKVSLQIQAA